MSHPFECMVVGVKRGLILIRARGGERQTTYYASSDDVLERFRRLFSACLVMPNSWAAVVWFPLARLRASAITNRSNSFNGGNIRNAANPSSITASTVSSTSFRYARHYANFCLERLNGKNAALVLTCRIEYQSLQLSDISRKIESLKVC